MKPDFWLGQGNQLPTLKATLKDVDGTLIPLDTVPPPEVRLVLRQQGYPFALVNAVALITDAAASEVEYVWEAGDSDLPGLYFGYWQVFYEGGGSLRVPNDGFMRIPVVGN